MDRLLTVINRAVIDATGDLACTCLMLNLLTKQQACYGGKIRATPVSNLNGGHAV